MRFILGAALILSVGVVAMAGTYLVARDIQRDAMPTSVSATQTMPVIPAPLASGTLRFTVEPVDATIRIDNVEYSSTSIQLPVGQHEVQVSRRGYTRWRKTIEVNATNTELFVVLAGLTSANREHDR